MSTFQFCARCLYETYDTALHGVLFAFIICAFDQAGQVRPGKLLYFSFFKGVFINALHFSAFVVLSTCWAIKLKAAIEVTNSSKL